MSENFVAPSASAIRMTLPLELMVPFKRDRKNTHLKPLTQIHAVLHSDIMQSDIPLTIRTAPPLPLFFTSVRTRILSAPYFLLYRMATWRDNKSTLVWLWNVWLSKEELRKTRNLPKKRFQMITSVVLSLLPSSTTMTS